MAHDHILCGLWSAPAALHGNKAPRPCQHASDSIQWSIIVPAHNEAARILPYLQRIVSHMQNRGQPYEIFGVDDGNTDATASIVETMASSDKNGLSGITDISCEFKLFRRTVAADLLESLQSMAMASTLELLYASEHADTASQ